MKKIEKIKLIERPRTSLLDNEDMSKLTGGAEYNCQQFTECGLFRRDKCISWSSGTCSGGGGEDYCNSYYH